MFKSYSILLLFFSYSLTVNADIILFEDFEDSSVTYTTNINEASDDEFDYFGRVSPNGLSVSSSVAFNNVQGSGYFAAMDTDALADGPDIGIVTFVLDISGFDNLTFSGLFAEDDASDGEEDWDANTSFLARYRIDGGDYQNLLAFESSGGTNTAPLQDTNFDGVGDGAQLNADFTEYQSNINGVGNQLTLEFILNNFDAGDEDIAFDNISIVGSQLVAPVPIPGAFWLFISSIFSVAHLKRRR